MSVVLFILCLLAFLAGVSILADAKSAIHEIEGFLFFVIAAILLIGAGIIDAVKTLSRRIEQPTEKATEVPAANVGAATGGRMSTSATARAAQDLIHHLPKPSVEAAIFYYAAGEGELGPYTAKDMKDFRRTGVLADETLIFKQGEAEWKQFDEFAQLTIEDRPIQA